MNDLEKLALEQIIKIDKSEQEKMIEASLKVHEGTINVDTDIYPIKTYLISKWAKAILDNQNKK